MLKKLLPANENALDRGLRIVGGLGILSLFFVGPQTPWALLGVIPLVTGLLGSCPLYTLLGVSTCSMKSPRTPA
jgi:hypothetical protein